MDGILEAIASCSVQDVPDLVFERSHYRWVGVQAGYEVSNLAKSSVMSCKGSATGGIRNAISIGDTSP